MRIYRVEMPGSGAGPYSPCDHDDFIFEMKVDQELDQMYRDHKHDTFDHPTPFSDGEMPGAWDVYIEWDFRCGFMSQEQLVEWFGPWMHKLSELGFLMSTYEVPAPHYLVGRHQMIFNKPYATLVAQNVMPLHRMEVAA